MGPENECLVMCRAWRGAAAAEADGAVPFLAFSQRMSSVRKTHSRHKTQSAGLLEMKTKSCRGKMQPGDAQKHGANVRGGKSQWREDWLKVCCYMRACLAKVFPQLNCCAASQEIEKILLV